MKLTTRQKTPQFGDGSDEAQIRSAAWWRYGIPLAILILGAIAAIVGSNAAHQHAVNRARIRFAIETDLVAQTIRRQLADGLKQGKEVAQLVTAEDHPSLDLTIYQGAEATPAAKRYSNVPANVSAGGTVPLRTAQFERAMPMTIDEQSLAVEFRLAAGVRRRRHRHADARSGDVGRLPAGDFIGGRGMVGHRKSRCGHFCGRESQRIGQRNRSQIPGDSR